MGDNPVLGSEDFESAAPAMLPFLAADGTDVPSSCREQTSPTTASEDVQVSIGPPAISSDPGVSPEKPTPEKPSDLPVPSEPEPSDLTVPSAPRRSSRVRKTPVRLDL